MLDDEIEGTNLPPARVGATTYRSLSADGRTPCAINAADGRTYCWSFPNNSRALWSWGQR